ncbi:MAG: ABC transporter substrate-binding protein [Gammaproteobacteria bacterium]
MTTRRVFLKSSAAVGASSLLPLYTRAPAAVNSGGTLTVAIFADPLTFDPHLTGNLQGRATTQAVHDTLLTVDKAGRLAPNLAESWVWRDGKTIDLGLRKGVKFHDGTDFDADAVRYNIERIRDPETGSIRGGEIGTLDTVEVVDSHTVRLTLKHPFAAFLFPLIDVSGCIASPSALEKYGKDYGLHPAGTGPFKVADYLKDAHSVLEKNGDYWNKGKPGVDQLILRPIPVDSTRLAELRSGGVQFAESLPLQDIKRLRQSDEIVVSEKVGFRWEYFGFNLRDEYPGRSRAFRQAFQWAIDREALHHIAYFGTGSVGYDGILPGSPFHDAEYKPFSPDMDRAKRLLDESGVDLPVSIKAPLRPDPVKQRAAQIFQATAEELGVKVEIEQTDSAGYRSMLKGGTMPVDLQGWWGYRPDPDQYLYILLHSTGSYAKRHGYNNPEMDKLLDGERASRSEGERRELFRKLSHLMNEDAVYVPWHYSSDFKGHHPNVKGFVHYQDSIIRYEELYLEG